ncbi:MAG TPA: hypothetical protein DEH02_13310 [Bacteroidales bacterium]|nr:MAG: hypothetical protein A2X01_13600 [Bacteroidetes bacterium GWF2_35_48]OFZ00804.1 MAG: hypothetical protein A2491_21505 [Bacteroidetes bacterium RIFOXYC12_FULL_35_7]HBX52038.1 hypothetical protein [Bacteroidales bacterium]
MCFCLCEWVSALGRKNQRTAFIGTKLKAAIPTERIVGLCANANSGEANGAVTECSVAGMKWRR